MKKMTIEDKTGLDLYHTDEENSHIKVNKETKDEAEINKLVLACPAGCYTYIDGQFSFSHLPCFECGTCRVLCHETIVEDWNYPMGTKGVFYRQG